jgi:hypothetical protein
MIAEDVEVTIQIKPIQPAKDKDKELQEKLFGKVEPSLPLCKSSWISHLIMTDNQMDNSVRDYVVPSDRINSLLKEHKFSTKLPKD